MLFQRNTTSPSHEKKVQRIARELKNRKSKKPVSLKKKAVSHQVPKPNDLRYYDEKIDISGLNEILEIDPVNRTCTAEPGVTFEDLVDATMEHGLVPIIVPELKTITIGGAVAGCSIESMSFKHGGFHDTCLEFEVITAKGEVLHCTPDTLLFQMMHGTFGTLGILSLLKFKLIPSKPYVNVRFQRFNDVDDFKEGIWKHYNERDVDFMDGFIHSPDEFVINAADFVDDAPYTHDYEWLEVFYQNSRKKDEDYLETPNYFFRYNNGVTNVQPFPVRMLLGKWLTSNEILKMADKLHSVIPSSMIPITIDLFIPFSKLEEFLGWYVDEIGHFPLWCVPYKRVRNYEWLAEEYHMDKNQDELILDLAIYGMKNKDDGKNYYRLMEEELMKIGGIKTLISHNYFTEAEFWSIWNRDNYMEIKKRTDPDNIFRDLYEKMCLASRGAGP
ncbi:MAG: FAD-binding oxidoreductase [Thermoplasmatota archaeon]